jgi:hypothetical protein
MNVASRGRAATWEARGFIIEAARTLLLAALLAGTNLTKITERINSAGVTVIPLELDGIMTKL